MTAFDAVIFDMSKILFYNNFFKIAPLINYDKKFSLSDITRYDTFQEIFRKNH